MMELQRGGTGFAAHDKELQVGGANSHVMAPSRCAFAAPPRVLWFHIGAVSILPTALAYAVPAKEALPASALLCAAHAVPCCPFLRSAGQEAVPAGPRQRLGGPARPDGGAHQQVWPQVRVGGMGSWRDGQEVHTARACTTTRYILLLPLCADEDLWKANSELVGNHTARCSLRLAAWWLQSCCARSTLLCSACTTCLCRINN